MRFIQPDSVLQDVYDPQLLNSYSYVRNNPLKYTDKDGHFIQFVIAAIGIGYVMGSFMGIGLYMWDHQTTNIFNKEAEISSFEWGVVGGAVLGTAAICEVGLAYLAVGGIGGGMIGKKAAEKIESAEIGQESAVITETFSSAEASVSRTFNPAEILQKYNAPGANNPNSGRIFLGSEGSYKIPGGSGTYLDLQDTAGWSWKSLTEEQFQAVNKFFVDQAIQRHDYAEFTTYPKYANKGFQWEINYLRELGYKIGDYSRGVQL
jgi:hypothetical protein